MGRKAAPQPLTLAGSMRPGEDGAAGVGETVPKSARLPDAASPRSPRSPFRFGQKKSESISGSPVQHQHQQPLADVLHQPYPPTSPSQSRHPKHQPQESLPVVSQQPPQIQYPLEQQQQRQHLHTHAPASPAAAATDDNEARYPPLSSPVTTTVQGRPPADQRGQSPSSRQQQQQHQQQQQQPQPPQSQAQQQQQYHHHGHKHQRNTDDKTSKSNFFFNFGKSAKSSERLASHQHSESRAETMSRDSDHPSLSKQSTKQSDSSYQDSSAQKSVQPPPSRSEVSLASTSTDHDSASNNTGASSRKQKPKPFTLLGRKSSTKDKDGSDSKDSPSPKEPTPVPARLPEPDRSYTSAPLRTAPLQAHDRSFREMMSSAVRNHSAERSQPREIGGRARDHDDRHHRGHPSSFRETSGSAFFSNLKNSKAAGIISNRLFGGGRNEPAPPKEPVVDDEHYVIKVINLPLVEQTRLTRISKRLEESRDKTEFWMPAFPWRAIDYLNYKGSEVEGLYRIPGSGPQIKKWQRKFDEELDVDLFEQTDLYDINIVGSMLKAWLRELPDELFPKASQDRISRECAGAQTVPQMLVDELSNLSPFNYYLLFAITCHLSLLLAHSDKNKMDFRNLCICFQPCMKIDAFCFKFLVCDWRDCWKGCKNEAKYIEEEYALFDQPPPARALGEARRNGNPTVNVIGAEEVSEETRRRQQQPQQPQQPQPPQPQQQQEQQQQQQKQPQEQEQSQQRQQQQKAMQQRLQQQMQQMQQMQQLQQQQQKQQKQQPQQPQSQSEPQSQPQPQSQSQPPVPQLQPPPQLQRPKQQRNASDSSNSSTRGGSAGSESQSRLKKKALPQSESGDTTSTVSTTLTISSDRETPPRKSGELRPLSPIKPLSPLNF